MNLFFDIDGTICSKTAAQYDKARVKPDCVAAVNLLYEMGHRITYWTARGSKTGVDWREVTEKQLSEWGCKYHDLLFGKPDYDLLIDDKAVNAFELKGMFRGEKAK